MRIFILLSTIYVLSMDIMRLWVLYGCAFVYLYKKYIERAHFRIVAILNSSASHMIRTQWMPISKMMLYFFVIYIYYKFVCVTNHIFHFSLILLKLSLICLVRRMSRYKSNFELRSEMQFIIRNSSRRLRHFLYWAPYMRSIYIYMYICVNYCIYGRVQHTYSFPSFFFLGIKERIYRMHRKHSMRAMKKSSAKCLT